MTRYESVIDAIGATPLIRLTRSVAHLRPRIYVKTEAANPGGSVKDRAALWMLRQAEADGLLQPGGTVVETTSGNTGIGLALYAAVLGYRSVLFTSSATSAEKRSLLAAYGAEVRVVDAFVPKFHPDSLHSAAERFAAETPGAWLAGQYDNPANPAAHWQTTGPEVWADTDGQVTHLVSTVGTGGTISGTGGYLKQVSGGRVQVVGADPATSAYSGGDGAPKYIEGAGHYVHAEADKDPWPLSFDTGVVDRFIRIPDAAAIEAIRSVARADGILAGGSSGVALAAAFTLAAELGEDDTVVVILPDSGRFYLSTYFNDQWLAARGFATPAPGHAGRTAGDAAAGVPAVIGRQVSVRDAIALLAGTALGGTGGPDAPVLVVYSRQRTEGLHPSEVAGWTTRRQLAAAGDARAPVSSVARKAAQVGHGIAAANAVDQLDQASPGWELALVLTDGRVTGVIDQQALRSAAGGVRGEPAATSPAPV